MYKNGVIIQDTSQNESQLFYTIKNKNYNGICRYPYDVICSNLDTVSLGLNEEISELNINWYVDENNTTHYYLDVIPTYDLFMRSVKHYLQLNIPIRILFIESEFDKPEWVGSVPKMNFLGYEYGSCEISRDPTMVYELENNIHPKFKNITKKLNKYFLFENYENILEYVKIRNDLISEGFGLENENPYYIMRISEININDIV